MKKSKGKTNGFLSVMNPSGTEGYRFKPPRQEDFDPSKDKERASKDIPKWADEHGVLKLNFSYSVKHVAALALDSAVHLLEGIIPVEWARPEKRKRMAKARRNKVHEMKGLQRRAKFIWYPRYGKSGDLVSHFEGDHVRDVNVKLEYPFDAGSKLTIHPYKRIPGWKRGDRREMSVGYVLWHVAREYGRIYRNAKKYGVWGHEIDDLCFEGFTLHSNGKIDLWIGS